MSLNTAFADQLAYITKAEAEKIAKLIKNKEIVLFCGCCDNDTPEKVKVIDTRIRYTNYEDYYEVFVTFQKADGEIITQTLDFAYVWMKHRRKFKTVGQILGMEHDPCALYIDWEK